MAAEGIANADGWGGVAGGVVPMTISGNSTQPAATASAAYTLVIIGPWHGPLRPAAIRRNAKKRLPPYLSALRALTKEGLLEFIRRYASGLVEVSVPSLIAL